MSLAYGKTDGSLKNRRDFLRELGIDYRDLVCAGQVHGSRVKFIEEKDKGKGALSADTAIPDTDAFITNRRNLPLAVFTADCLSVFIYDPRKSAIGLAHAGWRSSKENIVSKTVQLMQEKFGSLAQDLEAGFGPLIRQCCYEVGEEFNQHFNAGIIRRNSRYYLDLAGINKKQLLDSGLKEENITDPQICTACRNEEFFSFRKEGVSCGRMMSVMMLK